MLVLLKVVAVAGALCSLSLPVSENPIHDAAAANARDVNGWTPLMAAAQRGEPDVVRELLATGADPHAVAPGGVTALLAALEGGNREVVLTLLDEERYRDASTRADLPAAHLAAVAADPRARR
jgi:ankyrin repeat protein